MSICQALSVSLRWLVSLFVRHLQARESHAVYSSDDSSGLDLGPTCYGPDAPRNKAEAGPEPRTLGEAPASLPPLLLNMEQPWVRRRIVLTVLLKNPAQLIPVNKCLV